MLRSLVGSEMCIRDRYDTMRFSRQTIFRTKSYQHDIIQYSRQTSFHTKTYMYHVIILFPLYMIFYTKLPIYPNTKLVPIQDLYIKSYETIMILTHIRARDVGTFYSPRSRPGRTAFHAIPRGRGGGVECGWEGRCLIRTGRGGTTKRPWSRLGSLGYIELSQVCYLS